MRISFLTLLVGITFAFAPALVGGDSNELRLRISWGLTRPEAAHYRFSVETNQVHARLIEEPGASNRMDLLVRFEPVRLPVLTNLHSIWSSLLEKSEPSDAARLRKDAGFRADQRRLTFRETSTGQLGFTVTVDQLQREKALWVRNLDLFLNSSGEDFLSYRNRIRGGDVTVRERTEREPEASYERFASLWDDMGRPDYQNPHSVAPGHIVCLAWEGTVAKFGVDRAGNVRSDYGNPDQFRVSYDHANLSELARSGWKGQRLENGLPVISTRIERNGLSYVTEQFAYPLHGTPISRSGDVPMVLLQKVTIRNGTGTNCVANLGVIHERSAAGLSLQRRNGIFALDATNRVFLTISGVDGGEMTQIKPGTNRLSLWLELEAGQERRIHLKLPSPPLGGHDVGALDKLEYDAARKATLDFWEAWLGRGAMFRVPEQAVNELFRANLWHAMRLPRRHGPARPETRIDLPYSNFAYDQLGIPWPVNQAVYVDYMLYDLRGYHELSGEELAAMYRVNQEENGHVKGFANWGVYTPGMVYSVAKHFLLSGDRASFDRLLRPTLHAMDWCLAQVREAEQRTGPGAGLVLRPLNDLSHEPRAWAFNQAYIFAALQTFGQALERAGHPRARECRAAAQKVREAVEREFALASVASPLVPLRDGSWSPYVPSDALTPGRLLQIWYPTEVDTGPLHLARLEALEPGGWLADYMLDDHEDNLFYRGWSMANEPVYNQHATVYLLRDEVKPAIRAFYSMMACAFSHTVYEPVEHRWGWGQYFGPPSTDGAWFELYRNMLVREKASDALLLMQAAPRRWLLPGNGIEVRNAPTAFGKISFAAKNVSGKIRCDITAPSRAPARELLVRLRHPEGKPMRAVNVNGTEWKDFDPEKEWVRIPGPLSGDYVVEADYQE